MPLPFVATRIEQPNFTAAFGIDAGDVGAFMAIARKTGRRAIFEFISAAMLLGDDVFNFKGKLVKLRGHSAVFATVACSMHDMLSQGVGHDLIAAMTFFERLARFRFENRQHGPDPFVSVHLLLFVRGEGSFACFGGQLLHLRFFRIWERHLENRASAFGRKLSVGMENA